jgi:phage repressor protein C with HTH and peptisase S24 domain
MKPRIKDGEYVIVEPNREPQPGDEVLIKAIDGRVMVKTYLYKRDSKIHLISINESHPPQAIFIKDIINMHFIAAIVKNPLWMPD